MSDFVFSTNKSGTTSVYASDGTAAGTGSLGLDLVAQPSDFTAFGDKLYFIGTEPLGTGPIGGSLQPVFGTNGTAAGTAAVSYGGAFNPDNLDVVDGKLLSSGYVYLGEEGIFASSDGAGFTPVSDKVSASASGFVVSNGVGYFDAVSIQSANAGLWRTDGTTAGTYSINPAGKTLDPQGIAAAGSGRTAFINQEASGRGTLWVTNGTTAGTSEITNAALGADLNTQIGMVSAGGKAYFAAINAAGDYSVWGTDGTSVGTMQVFDGGPSYAAIRPIESIAAFGNKLLIVNGYSAFIYNGSTIIDLPLATVGGDNSDPTSYAVAGSRLFLAQNTLGTPDPQLYVSDGTVAGTVAVKVPGLATIDGALYVVGSGVVFEGTDTSGRQALFESDGTTAGSRELALPAGIAVDPTTVIAALPASATITQTLTATLPSPLYTGTETVTGTGGVAGLQLERITQGSYNTPGSTGWVKAAVQANGDWSAQLTFTKAGQLAHVYAENGGSASVVDLVNGTPATPAAPPPPPPQSPLAGVLPSPLHTGEETITGTGGVAGLRLERITQGSYNTPGQTGWVTATVAANHTWSAQLTFTKPGQLAHVYAQNGGTGAVVDLVNGTPIAAAASSVSGSVAADMTARAGVHASVSASVVHLAGSAIPGGYAMPVTGGAHAAMLLVPDHSHGALHIA